MAELKTPELETVELETPELETVELETLELETPELKIPKVNTKDHTLRSKFIWYLKKTIPLTLLWLFVIANIIGLSMLVVYSYQVNANHFNESQCIVVSCHAYEVECCSGGAKGTRRCGMCRSTLIGYTLLLNNSVSLSDDFNKTSTYNKTSVSQSDDCPSGYITCYYDDRNIYNTLSLEKLSDVGSIIGIIFLSISLLLSLFISIVITVSCSNQFKK